MRLPTVQHWDFRDSAESWPRWKRRQDSNQALANPMPYHLRELSKQFAARLYCPPQLSDHCDSGH